MIDYRDIIDKNIQEIKKLLDIITKEEISLIIQIAKEIVKTLESGGCIFWCGNGGSASQSQHLAAEFIGRFKDYRQPYKSISLTSDSAVMTCISNDFGFDNLFSRQIDGLGKKGDLLIALSTSGNSLNIKNAIKKAKTKQIKSISILGKGGGEIKHLADLTLIINSNSTTRIQEMHALIGHIICEIVEEQISAKK